MKKIVTLSLLTASGFVLAGCSLFGTNDDGVVEVKTEAKTTTGAKAECLAKNYQWNDATSTCEAKEEDMQNNNSNNDKSNPDQSVSSDEARSYTLAEVKAHATEASCRAAIEGKVYDLTAWIARHPGGPGAIKSICGTDATAAFNGQHGGQQRPENMLASFEIGTLKQ